MQKKHLRNIFCIIYGTTIFCNGTSHFVCENTPEWGFWQRVLLNLMHYTGCARARVSPVGLDGVVVSKFPCQRVVFPGAPAGLAREHIPRGDGEVGHARHCARAFQLVDHLQLTNKKVNK